MNQVISSNENNTSISSLRNLLWVMFILGTLIGVMTFAIFFWGPAPEYLKIVHGDEIVSRSPFAARVIESYRSCQNPGLLSSVSKAQCKVQVAELIKLENGEAKVPEAMELIQDYELSIEKFLSRK